MNIIANDGRPRVMGLKELLTEHEGGGRRNEM